MQAVTVWRQAWLVAGFAGLMALSSVGYPVITTSGMVLS